MAVGLLVHPARAADTNTDARLRAMEQRLEQALRQLDAQRRATEEAQREIRELRRAMRAAAPPGGAAAGKAAVAMPDVEQRIDAKVREEVARTKADTEQKQAEIEREVAAMQPAWDDYARRWLEKFKVGTLVYGDWAFYEQTGFGPQFLTQVNPPGPGNDNYGSFDLTRTYLNFFFTPTDDLTFRLTPNIFRSVGASNQKLGKTGVGSNLDGNLTFRLKYAYFDFNTPFARLERHLPAIAPLHDAKITIGQQPNPLVAWEEDLYGYRFVNLVPWNYTSLSSSQVGLASHGPVKLGGRQYVDCDLGIYDNASFHAPEQSETKQGMARVTYYPFGAASRFDGLGITGFYDYGFPNRTPDSGRQDHVSRVAALLHYTTDAWGVAAEYDWGRNAYSSGNAFSGSGPADEFGVGTTPFADFDNLVRAIQNNPDTNQEGFAVFGRWNLPRTPFSLFGTYQQFMPNTRVATNPLDFRRIVAGVGYRYNKYLRFALDSQTLDYYHDQFDFPLAEARRFGSTVKSDVRDAVPDGIQAVFLNVELSY
jgi:hypothetical protein